MDRTSLHKIIQSFILPKYPWIVDYHIDFYYDSPIEKYTVTYHTDSPDITDKEDEVNEVEKLSHSLFKMLGLGRNQSINDVEFVYKGK